MWRFFSFFVRKIYFNIFITGFYTFFFLIQRKREKFIFFTFLFIFSIFYFSTLIHGKNVMWRTATVILFYLWFRYFFFFGNQFRFASSLWIIIYFIFSFAQNLCFYKEKYIFIKKNKNLYLFCIMSHRGIH